MTAIEQWRSTARAHSEQDARAQAAVSWSDGDEWAALQEHFRDDPHRTNDPLLARLLRDVDAETTVLDVGGGAGRYALPLALAAAQVTVAEPSQSMVESLQRNAGAVGVDNVSVVQAPWEEASVEPADLVLCAHVLHGVPDVEPFVRKLEAQARRRVCIVEPMEPSAALLAPFWEAVHGEAFAPPPAFPQLLSVLWELGIYPNVEMFEAPAEAVGSRADAEAFLRHLLYVQPDSEQDERLLAAVQDLVEETRDGGVTVKSARPRRLALASWPGSAVSG